MNTEEAAEAIRASLASDGWMVSREAVDIGSPLTLNISYEFSIAVGDDSYDVTITPSDT